MAKVVQFVIPPATMPEIKGIMANGCIKRDSLSNVHAHAHSSTNDEFFGWICSRQIESLGEVGNVSVKAENVLEFTIINPSVLLYHEYAHILTPDYDHGIRWRNCLRSLGFAEEADRYDRSQPKQQAAGNWLIGERIRIKDEFPVTEQFRGQTARIKEVRRTRVVLSFETFNSKMVVWPVEYLERI